MFKLMDKTIIRILLCKSLLNWPFVFYMQAVNELAKTAVTVDMTYYYNLHRSR